MSLHRYNYTDPEYEIISLYNDGKHYEFAYRLGLSAAKKWSSKVTDAQLINAIKKGRKTGDYFKKTDYLVWELFGDYFQNSNERDEANDRFTEHVRKTAFKEIGKKTLKQLYGNLPDEKLLDNVVDLLMYGDMGDDIYPYGNIDYGFETVIAARLKAIGKKNREKALKKKIALKKKQFAKKTPRRK